MATYIFSLAYCAFWFLEVERFDELIWIILLTHTLRITLSKVRGSLSAVLSVAFIFLFALPSIGILILFPHDIGIIIVGFIVFSDVFLWATKGSCSEVRAVKRQRTVQKIANNSIGVVFFLTLAAILPSLVPTGSPFGGIAFSVPFSISLLLFEVVLQTKPKGLIVLLLFAACLGSLTIYILEYWSGYGRLLVGSMIMMPVLLVTHYRDIGLRFWQLIILAPGILTVAQLSRYGTLGGFETVLIGSAGHHMLLSVDIIEQEAYRYVGGILNFIQQYALLWLNWFPRDIWSSKPLGVGFTSVDDWFGREGKAFNYSVSIGMFGEQSYFLGKYFIVGFFATVGSLVGMRKFVNSYSSAFVTPQIIFDVSLISYIWGGMALFGSRTWPVLIPALAFSVFLGRKRWI